MCLFIIIEKAKKWMGHKYYRSKIQGKKETLAMKGTISIVSPQKITVGANCCINDGVQIHAGGGITLGNNVTVSMGAKLITRSYDTHDWYEQCQKNEYDKNHIEKSIFLNDHTWIGAGAIVLPGVHITGKGVIISAGTVISKDIEEDYLEFPGSFCNYTAT